MSKAYQLELGSVQAAFHDSRKKIQIFGGAFANGKSSALIIKALQLVHDYPGCLGLLGRATYPKLNDTLRRDFIQDWCPKSWIKRYPTQEDNSLYFNNGSTIHFRYIAQRGKTREDGSTTSNLLSATYDFAVIDQVEDPEIVYKDFLDIMGRLRRQTPYRGDDDSMPSTGPRWLMLGANPAQNWLYREIVYPYILFRDKGVRSDKLIVDESTGDVLLDLFEDTTYGNRKNLTEDFIRGLEATYKGQMRERYLLGRWAAFEGLVHPGFDHAKHLMSRDTMLDYLHSLTVKHVEVTVLEGYDFGNVSPSCYMLGFVDDFGRVFIIDGFYKSEYNYMQQPDEIYDLRSKYGKYLTAREPILADPSIFKRSIIAKRQTGTTIARELREFGLNMTAADNSIVSGIAKVNAYLAGKLGCPHIVTGDDPGPLIYVCDDLHWFLDEIGSYYWKRNPQQAFTDEPVDHNDHAMNVLKYMLSRLPEPAKIIIPRDKLPPQWMYWNEMSTEEYNKASKGWV